MLRIAARTGLAVLAGGILFSALSLYREQAQLHMLWQRETLSGFVRSFSRMYSEAMSAHQAQPALVAFMSRPGQCLGQQDLQFWNQLLGLQSASRHSEHQTLELLAVDSPLPATDNSNYPDTDIHQGALRMVSRVLIGRQCQSNAPVILRQETLTQSTQQEQPFEQQMAAVGRKRIIGHLALKDRDSRWFVFAATAQSRRISFSVGNGPTDIPPDLLANPFTGVAARALEQRNHLVISEHDPYTGASFVFLSPPLGEGFANEFLQRNSLQLLLSLALLLALVCIELFLQHSIRTSVRLHHMATHDPLTGVLNRRAILALADQEVARAKRSGSGFALLQIDIDHFKRINDAHGHPCGDAALTFFTGLLRSTARQLDQIARIGGEEFLVLLPDTGLAGAEQLATRLLEQLKATPLKFQQLQVPMTCSFGVTAWRGETDTLEDMLVRGDRLLYQAKHNGRARYESQAAD